MMDRVAVGGMQRIEGIIGPSVTDMGYDLVRVSMSGTVRPILQIMIERCDRQSITVEDCEAVSRSVSALLDVQDPIPQAYQLQVSSPGIDRPLTRDVDFERFAGHEARIELDRLLGGRKRFKGKLIGREGDSVALVPEGAEEAVALPLSDIRSAKLVLTDELIAATAAGL
jgi:ribosome maturation factor RimP